MRTSFRDVVLDHATFRFVSFEVGTCGDMGEEAARAVLKPPPSTCAHRASQPDKGVDATVSTNGNTYILHLQSPPSAHRSIGIAADQVESKVSGAGRGVGGGWGERGVEEAVEGGPLPEGWRKGVGREEGGGRRRSRLFLCETASTETD